MASNIPIRDITQSGTPSGTSLIVFDDGGMKKGTVAALADAVRPVASQSDAQTGSDNAKTMTPLRVKQSIASEVGASIQPYSSNLASFASKTAPSGSVVGTSDTQTLTGKTIDGDNNTITNLPISAFPDLAPVASTGAYADLTGAPTLGSAAAEDTSAFATAAQGALAETALQAVPSDSVTDAEVATPATVSDGIDIAKLRYNQGATNAVNRFAIARLRDSLHLSDFGLLGVSHSQDTTILTNAIGALAAGGTLLLPAGTFYAESEISVTAAATIKGITLRGAGKDATEIVWVNDTNGLSIGLSNEQPVDISDIAFKSDVAMTGTHTGLLIASGSSAGSARSSSLRRLSFTGSGSAPYSKGFVTGIDLFGLSFVSLDDIDVFGGSYLPNGVNLHGDSDHIPIVVDFAKCRFIHCDNGIFYNSWTQGVTVNQCNFTNGHNGIVVPSGAASTGLAQLVVANSQFNTDTTQISIAADIISTTIHGNYLIVPASQAGISINGGSFHNIKGNLFFNPTGVKGNIGVNANANASGYPNIINGNIYNELDYGNVFGSSSSGWNVQSNAYSNVTTPNNNFGTGNTIGGGSV